MKEFLRRENEFVRSRQAELSRAREQWRELYSHTHNSAGAARREKKVRRVRERERGREHGEILASLLCVTVCLSIYILSC